MPFSAGFRNWRSVAVAGLLLAACAGPQKLPQAQASGEGVTIFHNGEIITVDEALPQAEAMAVSWWWARAKTSAAPPVPAPAFGISAG